MSLDERSTELGEDLAGREPADPIAQAPTGEHALEPEQKGDEHVGLSAAGADGCAKSTVAQWLRSLSGPQDPQKLAEEIERVSFEDERGLHREIDRLQALLNTPELVDFTKAVQLEAAHQRERWPSEQDEGKTPADWFWLLGFLSGKALQAHVLGHREKALHHTISSAAALANWHAAILGKTNMRPGIADPDGRRHAG